MPIQLKNLPSLLAIPYSETLKKDSIQRKDFQRLVLENALSLNAIISLSNYYLQNKPNEDGEKKEKFPELKNFDLGQISVGTWNMFSRESTRAMGANPKALFLNNIYELYHGSKAKEWDDLSGSLISIRNKDAHGELIPADKLGAELDKRQVILDKFVENLSFYNDYKIIVPVSTNLEAGKVQYNCRDFSGTTENSLTIGDSIDELEVMRVYLYNIKSKRALKLNPMLIAHFNQPDVSSAKLFIYSKTINKKTGNLHYLSLDSSKDFLSNDSVTVGDYFTGEEICGEFQNFRIYVEDPSLHDQKKPQLDISRVLKSDFIGKNDLLEMSFNIKNEGEISADNVKIVFNYPEENFVLTDSNGDAINSKKGLSSLWDEDLVIDAGQSYGKKLYFQPKDKDRIFSVKEDYYSILSKLVTEFKGVNLKPEEYFAWNMKKFINSKTNRDEYDYLATKPDTTVYYTLIYQRSLYYKTHKDLSGIHIRISKNSLNFQYRVSMLEHSIDLYNFYKHKSSLLEQNPILDYIKVKFQFDETKNYARKAMWEVGAQLAIEYPFAYQTDIFDIEKLRKLVSDLNSINKFLMPEDIFEQEFKLIEDVSEGDDVLQEIFTFRSPEQYNDLLEWRENKYGFKFKELS